MSSPRADRLALIVGCAGARLTAAEAGLFATRPPFGFILFQRNCESPTQVRALVDDLRAAVGDPAAPVLIDQEGGRVRRLRGVPWHDAPAAAVFGALAAADPARAERAAWLNSRLIADDLAALGISVDCLPCLDLRFPQTHAVIGDRAYGRDPAVVARLGLAAAEGLAAGGVLPVMKHMPGHGRATADSHLALPVVDAPAEELAATDFAPFAALAGRIGIGMTGHIVYPAIDPAAPATLSATVIAGTIRGRIGFDGLLLSDDINMSALSGGVAQRATAALAAGCDVALHCNGRFEEMAAVLGACPPMTEAAWQRWDRARAGIPAPAPLDRAEAARELSALLASVAA